jgi:hypothetical protein
MVSTLAWLPTMIWSMWDVKPDWDKVDYLQKVMRFEFSFIIAYMNGVLLTVLALLLFWILFEHYVLTNRGIVKIALFFLFIYGTINLVVYSSQLIVLPILVNRIFNTDLSPNDISMVYNWIQMAPGSKMAQANAFAYAFLAIPSIIFGVLMMKENRQGRIAGWLLIANAFACIAGVMGLLFKIQVLQSGTVIGGVLFLVALFFIYRMFYVVSKQ